MSSSIAIDAHEITRTHDQATHHWHDHASHFPAEHGEAGPHAPDHFVKPSDPLMLAIVDQHHANFDLWHQEDLARDMAASAEKIATVKHAIDLLNQRRNDLVEDIDAALLCSLPYQDTSVPLNSEPPGLIIDRLSILALKIYHTREEALRNSATHAHRHRNLDRLSVLEEQRRDLADCLDALWKQVLAGERRFKLYRQMKMYNDPQLNPVLYQRERSKRGC